MFPQTKMPARRRLSCTQIAICVGWLLISGLPALRAEVILQYFNTTWAEITFKMPEIAEAGYSALWLPPPTKGSGGLSVGYDLWDPFDLGDKDQRGSTRTRYGTKEELLLLIETAHRFGMRVYFDNIMNHRAFDIPGFNENTPIDLYPGMVPEDFHLRVTPDGFYRKWDNTRNWSDEWQVQNLGLADLIDIAQEPGSTNFNFGPSEGSTAQKIKFLRDPYQPDYYCYLPGNGSTSHADGNGIYVGFGPGNGITEEILQDNREYYSEWVEDYLQRAARWLVNETKADGLRLDAVKHVRADFFGATGAGADASDYGYTGAIQKQFNLTRGFSDWDNHRDSNFSDQVPRDDAMIFGEHLGAPPGFGQYVERGMRLVDAPLHREMNSRLGNPWSGLGGLDTPGWSGDPNFNQFTGISFAQSHDDDFANRRELQHAYYILRQGIANVYTDGNYKAEILGESGGAFPRHANNPFLGQFGDLRLPNLLAIHADFARGTQVPKWSDGDVVAFERRDKRENPSMSDVNGTVLLFMMNDNYSQGTSRTIQATWPRTAGGADTYLYNYSTYGGGFYAWASDIAAGTVIIPPGGYFAFSLKNPDPSELWSGFGGEPISIYEDGEEAGTLTYARRDGPDGDPAFNPQGLANRGYEDSETPLPFTYLATVPRVTAAENLRFVVRADGSAHNMMLKLNGGIDLNSQMELGPETGDLRDNPPALGTDTWLGYEQMGFVHRQHPEKFAAADSTRNKFGSGGAETYHKVIGTGGFTIIEGPTDGNVSFDNLGGSAASFVFHSPAGVVGGDDENAPGVGDGQFSEDGSGITVWAKTNSVGAGFRMFFYHTLDGSDPEGAGGGGFGTTVAAEMFYQHNDDAASNDWWGSATIPKPPAGTELRYKIGIHKSFDGAFPVAAVRPENPGAVAYKSRMLTVFEIDEFDATTVTYHPHNDYGATRQGLPDGFHVLRGRALLDRPGQASIFNTFTQSFYLDTEPPQGEIAFPQNNLDTVGGQEYEAVIRTDATITEVWYHISDSDPSNDDDATGILNGIGTGFESYTDLNQNGQRDEGELFTDLNGNGIWDADIGDSWVRATAVTPNPAVTPSDPRFIKEWRLKYRNIPATGTADIRVRLVELSSVQRDDWSQSLSDADGHFNTLTRTVNTAGPDIRFFTAWPRQDGDQVGPGYAAKIYFTKSLADGVSEQQLIERFLVRLQTQESGRIDGGVPLNRDEYSIIFDETNAYHALEFEVPNLFNGQPDWLHGMEVTFTSPSQPVLRATRRVTAFPVPPPPRIEIVNPVEIGSDGRLFEIILPELASPAPEDRQFIVRVATDEEAESVTLDLDFGPEGFAGTFAASNSTSEGNGKFWDFVWSDLIPGQYRFTASVTQGSETNTARRNSRVFYRQLVEFDATGDSDNDGIPDDNEGTQIPLPSGNPDAWTNGQVHAWFFSGRTNPLSPNSDGGGLPDGLQLGLTGPINPAATDLIADTSGDGFPNFIPDLDPPRFNTFDNAGYQQTQSRTNQRGGSMTDPARPDTDNDGLRDSEEDLNRNGRVDIGLIGGSGKVESILMHPNIPTLTNTSSVDRNALPSNAIFLETDANNPDTIGDGLMDGQSDLSRNARVDIVLLNEDTSTTVLDYTDRTGGFFQYNRMPDADAIISWDNENQPSFVANAASYDFAPILSRAVHWSALLADYATDGSGALQVNGWPKLLILETDPLVIDTIGDGLPDGWKVLYGLDPLDNGSYNFRTGLAGNPVNGPDGDLTGDGITNLQHFENGTDPRSVVTFTEPPSESISVGPGARLGLINGVSYFEEFSQWTADDLIVLDAYEGDGPNNQGGDIFPAGDGFDSSRDLVAFYARDGVDKVFFRVDMHDLRAFAENGFLNIYVAVNASQGVGERVLPDQVDTLTDMRWRAVVAVYGSSSGRVFVDTDPAGNTNNFGDNLFSGNGVEVRDDAFIGAYFNSGLDAVEFAIDRQALLDSGWLGDNFNQLNFQVFTTKDGTGNTPPGAGDLGGRSDLRDTITDDRVVENNFFSQAGREDILKSWFSKGSSDDIGKRAKVMLVVEGNQAILPGHETQLALNDDAGAGWHRAVAAHEIFNAPLTLNITPTLASSLQWATVDPAANKPWKDGPAFNQKIASLAQSGAVHLLGTTFSGHILPYTPVEFDAQNIDLSTAMLESIYGTAPDDRILYVPERVIDSDVFTKLNSLGITHTFIDQRQHMQNWFGRQSALGNDGYRINRINGIDTLVITEDVGGMRFTNHDGGASMSLRQLLSRKARSNQQDQVIVLLMSLDDFSDKAKADAYERAVRWSMNRAWVEIVTPADLIGNSDFAIVERGTNPSLPLESTTFIQYASQGSYDNWYFGTATREGLEPKLFESRPGQPLPAAYGLMGTSGIIQDAWLAVDAIDDSTESTDSLLALARGALNASQFVTAFHNQSSVDLRKFSTGNFINPATGNESLAGFSKIAQSQARHASVYARVAQWAQDVAANTITGATASQDDIDLDGEPEYLLFNEKLFVIFESLGGRMTGAWLLDTQGEVVQVTGNFLSYAGGETEVEGTTNATPGGTSGAHRTSGFKDWFAQTGGPGVGTSGYVNAMFTGAAAPDGIGWTLTSPDGKVVKTIRLDADASSLDATYDLIDIEKMFVRFGLAPDLLRLLLHGQQFLGAPSDDGTTLTLNHASPERTTSVALTRGVNTAINPAATDRIPAFNTVNMRNQAQTHQLELEGTGTFSFILSFSSESATLIDTDEDGIPDWWEQLYFEGITAADAADDPDGDGLTNLEEYLFGTHPLQPDRWPFTLVAAPDGALSLTWPTLDDRFYHVWWSDDLVDWQRVPIDFHGDGDDRTWVDDGTHTVEPPGNTPRRFYKIIVTPL